jgi:hypothetical protein
VFNSMRFPGTDFTPTLLSPDYLVLHETVKAKPCGTARL